MILRVVTLLLSLVWTLAMPALAQIQPPASQREQTIRNEAIGVPTRLAFSACGRDLIRVLEQGELRHDPQASADPNRGRDHIAAPRRVASVDERYRSDWQRRWRHGQSRDDSAPA